MVASYATDSHGRARRSLHDPLEAAVCNTARAAASGQQPTSDAIQTTREAVNVAMLKLLTDTLPRPQSIALRDASTRCARDWLHRPLTRANGTLPTCERANSAIVALAVGCDVLPRDVTHCCYVNGTQCSSPPVEPTATHVTCCKAVSYPRHNDVRDAIWSEFTDVAPLSCRHAAKSAYRA